MGIPLFVLQWLGRWFLIQTSDEESEDLEQDIREIRELLAENNDGDGNV